MNGGAVEFRLLGPVEVRAGGRSFDAGQPCQRRVLAALLVDAGRLVTVETLVERVWDDAPPDAARQALYSYLTRIRRLLARAAAAGAAGSADPAAPVRAAGEPEPQVVRRPGGYLIDVEPDRVDLHRLRHLGEAARDPELSDIERVVLLREALGLWRGQPLAGLTGAWVERVRHNWHQPRLAVVVAWARAELGVGNAAGVIAPLMELVTEYPTAEPLVARLMEALGTTGHTADALNCYARLRQRLADELGIDPGPEVQRVYRSLLGLGPRWLYQAPV